MLIQVLQCLEHTETYISYPCAIKIITQGILMTSMYVHLQALVDFVFIQFLKHFVIFVRHVWYV